MPGGPTDLGKFLPVRILVLISLGLQVILFLCAGVRRYEATGLWRLRRLFLWQAYIMADYTAIYALGHLSLRSKAHDHQLDAFWAAFLLLHLGGPDNITAYALQDNQLWLRHLQTLVLQVAGAFYVIYKSSAGGGGAPELIFAVGVAKYVERTWALKCGTLDSIRSSVKTQPPAMHKHSHRLDEVDSSKGAHEFDEESHLRRAHSLFHICKRAMVDCSVMEKDPDGRQDTGRMMEGKVELWRLMETELSLMYDILYTKAAVIHTWHGYCIRLISPIATFASLVLFRLSRADDEGRARADVIITYVLFLGALLMETASLLNALVSSWTFAYLSTTRWRRFRYEALCSERWDRLRRKVVSLHHLVMGGGSRYKSRRWSGNMGQYNMMHFCTRPDAPMTSPLLGRLAKAARLMETWNKKHFSGTANISDHDLNLIRERISKRMGQLYKDVGLNSLGMLRKRWGEEPLDRRGYKGFLRESLGVEFQEGIIVWHIGTDVFLSKSETASRAVGASSHPLRLVKAIKVLSNYMMFLLVERPYMLPGNAQSRLYQRTCQNLEDMRKGSATLRRRRKMSVCATVKSLFRLRDGPGSASSRSSDGEELAKQLYREHGRGTTKFNHDRPRIPHVGQLAKELLEMEKSNPDNDPDYSLKLVFEVWMDILVYAGNKCRKESHAKKLNDGGELTTIIWLMAEHFHQLSVEEDGVLREAGV